MPQLVEVFARLPNKTLASLRRERSVEPFGRPRGLAQYPGISQLCGYLLAVLPHHAGHRLGAHPVAVDVTALVDTQEDAPLGDAGLPRPTGLTPLTVLMPLARVWSTRPLSTASRASLRIALRRWLIVEGTRPLPCSLVLYACTRALLSGGRPCSACQRKQPLSSVSCYSFHTRNKSDVPGPPGASLSASQAYGGFPAKHFLTSLNLDLIVIKAGVVVCASLEWRGAPGWHGVQVCIGEVCSNDIAGCVV